ncbi:hypothetical protein [Pseudomonas sp. VD9]|uniref:hypothetical protein n=1 Tax=Pseudomonas sp. VD9 TaxID=3342076 RepID=UPI003C6C8A1C
MKNRALALVVVGACGIAPQAWAHQLAYSKTEQIQVNVDGEATSWCKPEVAITMQRPTWDDQKPLNTLLSKLPYILGQECPTAQVTWKAVDAKGAVYATGAGNASNLGLATLTSPTAATAAAAPAVSVAPWLLLLLHQQLWRLHLYYQPPLRLLSLPVQRLWLLHRPQRL